MVFEIRSNSILSVRWHEISSRYWGALKKYLASREGALRIGSYIHAYQSKFEIQCSQSFITFGNLNRFLHFLQKCSRDHDEMSSKSSKKAKDFAKSRSNCLQHFVKLNILKHAINWCEICLGSVWNCEKI